MKLKKLLNKDFWSEVLITSVLFFGVEIIFRMVSGFTIFDWATLRILLSSFILATIIEVIVSFIKKKRVRLIIIGVILFIVSVYAWLQTGFRNFLGVYISLGTSSQAPAVLSYVKEFLASYHIEYYLIWIPMILYIIYLFLPKKWSKKYKKRIHIEAKGIGVLAIVLVGAFYLGTIHWDFMQNPIQMISNEFLFSSPTNSSIAVNQFGTSVYGILDVKQLLFPNHNIRTTVTNNKKDPTEYTRVFDDSAWESIIAEEKNTTMNTLNRYFINRDISEVNDYTGYFEGKNVIVIMLESVGNIILNEEYYPNFARILSHSWYWENNYSPRNSCATGDNEFSGMTSLYALNASCTANTYQENTYFTSIFNRFREKGYHTSSYHDLDDTYYTRSVFHLNMGSEAYYDGNRLGIDFDSTNYNEWPSDVDFIEQASEIFTDEEPFMAWLTTVSAHQPYDSPSVLGEKYFSLFDDTDYPDTLKRYMSKLKVTDDALGRLLDILEEKGILEDTVIVMYGDHYPYGLVDSDVQAAVDYDVEEFYEIEQTPFVIYNSELEPKVFSEKTSYMNILPTIANLFNLDYDPRFYLGEDLFSEDFSDRVVFADSSWEDAIARYDAGSGTVTYFGSDTYSTRELQAINTEIYQKKEMSKLAIMNNYFDYLEKKLDEKKGEKSDTNEETDDSGISSQE